MLLPLQNGALVRSMLLQELNGVTIRSSRNWEALIAEVCCFSVLGPQVSGQMPTSFFLPGVSVRLQASLLVSGS